jgi:hypothetical protein
VCSVGASALSFWGAKPVWRGLPGGEEVVVVGRLRYFKHLLLHEVRGAEGRLL